jgi:hypothetical protein
MKIGIFGDSYANYNLDYYWLDLAWPQKLAQIHEVTNFGQVGSAFQRSYELFLKEKDKFDLSIVVVAEPTRVYIKALEEIPNRPVGDFFASINHINAFRKITTDEKVLKILDSVEVWYRDWRDHRFEFHIHNLMVDNLLKHDNLLLIPGAPDSINGYQGLYKNLRDIQFWELQQIDSNFNYLEMVCKRKCHFSDENNQVLFNLVLEAINGNKKILDLDITRFKKPSREISYYAVN